MSCGRSFFLERKRSMSQRKIEIKVRLNRKEAEALNQRVRKSRLSREAYLRHLIDGTVPREAPPPDYYAMMRELYRIGNSLNQVAQKAHTLNVVDVQRYDAGVRQLEAAIKKITEAVILPQPMEQTGAPHSRGTLRGGDPLRNDESFNACSESGKRSVV